ncbi:MAG: 5'/3'-nucleotidase SurE [Breznakibacter sp.]
MEQGIPKPLILVTNDDGVHAKGICSLIDMVRPYGDVVVVAPDTAQSAMGHAITVKTPLHFSCIEKEEGLTVYKSNGTPADCVKLALNVILPRKPDLCVSGINHGTNSSVSVHYSGTLAGAREAAFYGIPSIGFSLLSYDSHADFSMAVKHFLQVLAHVLNHGMPDKTYLNVNAPYPVDPKGIRVVRQARGRWVEEFMQGQDPRGNKYYWLTGHLQNDEPHAPDTDEYVLAHGYVSVVPCTIDITEPHAIDHFKQLEYAVQMQ